MLGRGAYIRCVNVSLWSDEIDTTGEAEGGGWRAWVPFVGENYYGFLRCAFLHKWTLPGMHLSHLSSIATGRTQVDYTEAIIVSSWVQDGVQDPIRPVWKLS